MSVDQLIALLTSVGTLFIAIATFFSLKEIKKQRSASYHPELVLGEVKFKAGCCEEDFFTWQPLDSNSSSNSIFEMNYEKSLFSLPLYNIGFGAAKTATVRWEFPIKNLIGRINNLAKHIKHSTYIKQAGDELYIVLGKVKKIVNGSREKNMKINFILPASVQGLPIELIIPASYQYLVSVLVLLSSLDIKGASFFSDTNIPPLTAIIEYFDIGNTKKSITLTLQVELIAVLDSKFFIGCLEPKYI